MSGEELDLAAMLAATSGTTANSQDAADGSAPSGSAGVGWLGPSAPWEAVAPMVSRLARRDPSIPVRLRAGGGHRSALAVVPAGVLVGRTVVDEGDSAQSDTPQSHTAPFEVDGTATAGSLLTWFDGGQHPPRADGTWRGGLPPAVGWRQLDTVPDTVVRDLVRQGALAHVEAAGREFGGAQGAEALLDAVVLTVDSSGVRVELTNRALSAVTSMGFLPRGSHITVAVSGRWNRVAAAYGSVFTERAGAALTVL